MQGRHHHHFINKENKAQKGSVWSLPQSTYSQLVAKVSCNLRSHKHSQAHLPHHPSEEMKQFVPGILWTHNKNLTFLLTHFTVCISPAFCSSPSLLPFFFSIPIPPFFVAFDKL